MHAVSSTPSLLLLVLVLPALALFTGLPSYPRILGVLNNVAHVPVFGTLAIVIQRILEREMRLEAHTLRLVSFLLTIATGIVIELVQPLIGRDGELQDIWTDALGAAAGLAIVEFRKPDRHHAAIAVLVIALAAAAWPLAGAGLSYLERNRQAPALLDITSPFDWFFISADGLQISQSHLPDAWRRSGDSPSILIQVGREPRGVLTLMEPVTDWRPYDCLMIDLTNPGSESLQLTLRIHDRPHNNEYADRFNRRISVLAGTRMLIEIPIADVATAPLVRRMDLSQIAELMLFTSGKPGLAGRTFYVTGIWLEPETNCVHSRRFSTARPTIGRLFIRPGQHRL